MKYYEIYYITKIVQCNKIITRLLFSNEIRNIGWQTARTVPALAKTQRVYLRMQSGIHRRRVQRIDLCTWLESRITSLSSPCPLYLHRVYLADTCRYTINVSVAGECYFRYASAE